MGIALTTKVVKEEVKQAWENFTNFIKVFSLTSSEGLLSDSNHKAASETMNTIPNDVLTFFPLISLPLT